MERNQGAVKIQQKGGTMEVEANNQGRDDDAPIQVGTRFRPSEIAWAKRATGAIGDGTAIACYVRKKMAEEGYRYEG